MHPVGLHVHRLGANASAVDMGGPDAELESRLVMRWLRGSAADERDAVAIEGSKEVLERLLKRLEQNDW